MYIKLLGRTAFTIRTKCSMMNLIVLGFEEVDDIVFIWASMIDDYQVLSTT